MPHTAEEEIKQQCQGEYMSIVQRKVELYRTSDSSEIRLVHLLGEMERFLSTASLAGCEAKKICSERKDHGWDKAALFFLHQALFWQNLS